jgi:ATP-dependent DNA helicase DinG
VTGNRFSKEAAEELRQAISEAEGREVFALGDVQDGGVIAVTICARGQEDRVIALRDRPRRGQVVIHNHPSGDLRPSDADMSLAGRYAEDGVGFVIVDSGVYRSSWIVEPDKDRAVKIDPALIRAFFEVQLPAAMPGTEPRAAQLAMALEVGAALSDGKHLLCEAGTGTGKSLAYLAPAALWAHANDGCVVIATHTRALQSQIVRTDAVQLKRAGLDVPVAVLEGRTNYVCRRRADLARTDVDDLDEDKRLELRALLDWIDGSGTGSRSELTARVAGDLWERVESDSDLTLRHRCPFFETCFYYEARRRANDARILVVNHALLLADLVIRQQGGGGILPRYHRVILDEAQHLEDVATGALTERVTRAAVRRALLMLVGARRKGSLERLGVALQRSNLPSDVIGAACRAAADAGALAGRLATEVGAVFDTLSALLDPAQPTRRVDDAWKATDDWTGTIQPQVGWLISLLDELTGHLDNIGGALGDHKLPEGQAQAWLDTQRARRRLTAYATACRTFLADTEGQCRWMQGGREGEVALCAAPINVADLLRDVLWDAIPGVVATSATLSVGGDYSFLQRRVGLAQARTAVYPSPFDHFQQAVLGLPTDLPGPDHPDFLEQTARMIVDAVRGSGGGAFVLCTSFRAVDHYAAKLRAALGPGIPVLAQGEVARPVLLERFREHHNAVLVGTDSFWEGVSVKGDGLRLVILPRLPFRVPTEPLQQARHELIAAAGGDPFKAMTLPQAVLKLRQGYGRLIRSTTDRGVVLLLDRRIHDKSYGRVVLAALPPARRVVAPARRVMEELWRFFGTPPIPPTTG